MLRLLRLTARNACWPIADPRLVAGPGRLDLDDVGAHVAQHLPAERPGHHLAELDDADAVERAGGGAARARTAACSPRAPALTPRAAPAPRRRRRPRRAPPA